MSELRELVTSAERIAFGPQGCTAEALRSLASDCERIAKELEADAMAPQLLRRVGSWVACGGKVDFGFEKNEQAFMVFLRNISATTHVGRAPDMASALRYAFDAAGR